MIHPPSQGEDKYTFVEDIVNPQSVTILIKGLPQLVTVTHYEPLVVPVSTFAILLGFITFTSLSLFSTVQNELRVP